MTAMTIQERDDSSENQVTLQRIKSPRDRPGNPPGPAGAEEAATRRFRDAGSAAAELGTRSTGASDNPAIYTVLPAFPTGKSARGLPRAKREQPPRSGRRRDAGRLDRQGDGGPTPFPPRCRSDRYRRLATDVSNPIPAAPYQGEPSNAFNGILRYLLPLLSGSGNLPPDMFT